MAEIEIANIITRFLMKPDFHILCFFIKVL